MFAKLNAIEVFDERFRVEQIEAAKYLNLKSENETKHMYAFI